MQDLSSLGIIKPSQADKGRTILIYGPPGRGKTTLLDTLQAPTLLINLDCGEQVLGGSHIDIFPLITSTTQNCQGIVKRFEGFAQWLLDQKELPWKYVCLDSCSELNDAFNESLTLGRGVKFPRINDYRDTGIEMKRWLRNLRNLTYKGCNVIYLAQEDTVKIEDRGGEVMSEKIPKIGGKAGEVICGVVDFILPLRIDKRGNRYLQLDSDYKYLAKKREEPGREYPDQIACPKEQKDTLAQFFNLIKPPIENERV